MKKIATIIVILIIIVITQPTLAAKEEATPSSKSKVDELKEKIASTVAQLNLVSKRAFVGEISKLEKTQITIESANETKIIDIDELTKYFVLDDNDKRKEVKFDSIGLSQKILSLGLYNKDSRKLLARIIMVKKIPIRVNGIVREVDIKGGTISVTDKKKNQVYIVDIEKTTKISRFVKAEGLVVSGLSKIEIGERAHLFGTKEASQEARLSASRILILPGKAVGIMGEKEIATSSPTPSKSGPTP
ncbi:hypothetical protein HYT17_03275 [Candidatus Microgenomates bacterium]|nr:hypothetical protein [Candidatus Microgenomates bacterium]